MPSISVFLFSFNGEKYISDQIDSIINQSYRVNEILICDDCSTDRTWEILEDYSNKFEYIKIFKNSHNSGIYSNFFVNIKQASGDWVAISDQDDVWLEDKIQNYITEILSNKKDLLYSESFICDSHLFKKGKTTICDQVSVLNGYIGSGVLGHQICIKTEVLRNIRNWREIQLPYDFVVLIAALSNRGIIGIRKPLTLWRRHDQSLTKSEVNLLNQIRHEENKKHPLLVLIKVISFLVAKNKIPNFNWLYYNISLVQKNFTSLPHVKNHLFFTKWYQKESLLGMILAAFYFSKLSFSSNVLRNLYVPFHYYYQCMTIYHEDFKTWR